MIPGVPSVGGGELVILVAIVLLLFGVKRLPELGRGLGRGIKEFKEGLDSKDEPKKSDEEHLEALEDKEQVNLGGSSPRFLAPLYSRLS
jgi:sec-independent protein translocase protein TatA